MIGMEVTDKAEYVHQQRLLASLFLQAQVEYSMAIRMNG